MIICTGTETVINVSNDSMTLVEIQRDCCTKVWLTCCDKISSFTSTRTCSVSKLECVAGCQLNTVCTAKVISYCESFCSSEVDITISIVCGRISVVHCNYLDHIAEFTIESRECD